MPISTPSAPPTQLSVWLEANQEYLVQAIARIRTALNAHILRNVDDPPQPIALPPLEPSELSPLSSLEKLCQTFSLSPFERDVLLLCAGMELEGDWEQLLAEAQGHPHKTYPTAQLALAVFPNAYWGALSPTAALRRWHLLDIGAGNSLASSVLRIDERVLNALMEMHSLDSRLQQLELPLSSKTTLVPSHQHLVIQMANTWLQASKRDRDLPNLQLCGSDVEGKRAIGIHTCQTLELVPFVLSSEALPTDSTQLQLVRCLCEREWHLSKRVVLLDCDWVDVREDDRNRAIAQFLDALSTPCIIASQVRRPQRMRTCVTFDVTAPSTAEQRQAWQGALGERANQLNGHIDALVSHFNMSATAIQSASLKIDGWHSNSKAVSSDRELSGNQTRPNHQTSSGNDESNHDESRGESAAQLSQQLWTVCREQARPRLDELAQRIDSSAGWEDLVLPDKERGILKDIATHIQHRSQVYERWGFGSKSGRGLGISALFAGGSGTGKTLAAEVLGHHLQLDVYRIDLSSVVSKYIGETEKNLRRVFDAAEGGGVILLFDEADSLFGKRTEVKDSHDRHANIEVSYLLQRMEAYRGLAILTTNIKSAIDRAFLRRIRFVVQFPFPDAAQREAIWQRMFPAQTPTEGLDCKKLAKLHVAGGNIRNIALNAAFFAADNKEPIQMKHLLQSAKSEYVKLEQSLTDGEVKGWV
ncbi:MAG: ATP-binding protein [Synechococcus sp.]